MDHFIVHGISGLTSAPDVVSAPPLHGPLVPAPGTSAEQDSSLSLSAQFVQLIWCWSRKASQAVVSAMSSAPLPFDSQVPHSVTNSASPLSTATVALSRNHCLWVAA